MMPDVPPGVSPQEYMELEKEADEPKLATEGPVLIHVRSGNNDRHRRVAQWRGDPGWVSMPREGDLWCHCPGWACITFGPSYWNGPFMRRDPEYGYGGAPWSITVHVSPSIFQHLIDVHEFVEL